MEMKSPQSCIQSPSVGMLVSVAAESSSCPTPPSGTTVSSAGPGSMWNTFPGLDLPSLKPSPLTAADTTISIAVPNDPDTTTGTGRSTGGGGFPSQASFIHQQEKFKLNKMLMDTTAANQQQQCFLGQQTNGGGGSLGFHEMLNTSQPSSPNCLNDRIVTDDPRKLAAYGELNDLRLQQASSMQTPTSSMLTSTSSSSSTGAGPTDGSTNNNRSSPVAGAPIGWNNLLDLSPLAVAGGGSNSCNTTASSSSIIMNTSNSCSSSCEDSYEAGIADDMRELELRLESELQLDENGI